MGLDPTFDRYDSHTATFANHPTITSLIQTDEWTELRTWFFGYAVSTQRQFYYVAESVREGKAEGLTQVRVRPLEMTA